MLNFSTSTFVIIHFSEWEKNSFSTFFSLSLLLAFSTSLCVSFCLPSLMRIYFCNLFDFTVDNFSPLSISLFFLLAVVAISHARQQNETHKRQQQMRNYLCHRIYTHVCLFVFFSLFYFSLGAVRSICEMSDNRMSNSRRQQMRNQKRPL